MYVYYIIYVYVCVSTISGFILIKRFRNDGTSTNNFLPLIVIKKDTSETKNKGMKEEGKETLKLLVALIDVKNKMLV